MSARIRSDIWVSAYLRRMAGLGAYGLVRHKGAAEAGAIAIVVTRRDGLAQLYLPAAQSDFDEARPSDRRFVAVFPDFGEQGRVDDKLKRERSFDPDLWVVDMDVADGDPQLG